MKKLMIASVAALCATAGFAVESANVVGYMTNPGTSGNKVAMGTPFVNVGTEALDIQSIVCKDGDDDPTTRQFTMQVWDPSTGYTTYVYQNEEAYAADGEDDGDGTCYEDKYYWCDKDGWILVPAGWKHDAEATPTEDDYEVTFAAGEAFFINAESTEKNPKVTVSGQVMQPATSVERISLDIASGNKTLVANPFGQAMDIQDIKCLDGENDPTTRQFTMMVWNPSTGYTTYVYQNEEAYAADGEEDGDGTCYDDKYYWCDKDGWILVPAGWKHDAEATPTEDDYEVTFGAGVGFYINAESTEKDPKVSFANPFYVAE